MPSSLNTYIEIKWYKNFHFLTKVMLANRELLKYLHLLSALSACEQIFFSLLPHSPEKKRLFWKHTNTDDFSF